MPASPVAEILPTHTSGLFTTAVHRAAERLRAGEVVAVPTETVYGLAANALDPGAVRRIFKVKGRPAHNPIIVHVAGMALAQHCTAIWPEAATELARAFWPGPLTLVLPRAAAIPDIVTASGATVGIRWPSHPFIQALIRECGFPLAAPSANLSSRLSPTTAEHVRAQLGDCIPLIVDGGPSQVGIESTVLDLVSTPPRILRPGMIHEASLAAVLGPVGSPPAGLGAGGAALPSPGLLRKHYSPKARLVVLDWRDETDLRTQIERLGAASARTQVIAHSRIPSGTGLGGVSVIPHDPEAFARALYAELHRCDAAGTALIAVEALPAMPEWRAIADRLARAAAGGPGA